LDVRLRANEPDQVRLELVPPISLKPQGGSSHRKAGSGSSSKHSYPQAGGAMRSNQGRGYKRPTSAARATYNQIKAAGDAGGMWLLHAGRKLATSDNDDDAVSSDVVSRCSTVSYMQY
jgi:hypothetical protein